MISNVQTYLEQIKERSLVELVQSQTIQVLQQLICIYEEEGCKLSKVNFSDNEGFTALHKACVRGIPDIAELLLSNGANPNAVNNGGETPVHIAARRGSPTIVNLLKIYNADLEISDNKGLNIAHNAVFGDSVLVLLWVESSTNISFQCKDENGMTPFHWSCVLGKRNCIKFFLRKSRCDIRSKTSQRENYLHLLVKHKQLHCVPLILLNFTKRVSIFPNENQLKEENSDILSGKNSDNKTPIDLYNELPEKFKEHNRNFSVLFFILNLTSTRQLQLNFSAYRIFLFLFPFVSFLIGILLEIFILPNYRLIIYPITATVAVGFVRCQSHRINALDSRQNPIFAGAFLAGIVHDLLCFHVNIYPHLTSQWESIMIGIVLPIFFLSYFRLIVVDPGTVQLSEIETDNFSRFLSNEMNKQNLVALNNLPLGLDRFCQTCEMASIIHRVKHCKLCDICVVNIDHHCLFLMKCIARNNIRNFIILIAMSLVLIGLFLYCCVNAIISKCGTLSGASPLPYVYCSYTQQTWISTGFVFNAISFIWGAFMLYSQLHSIGYNATYYYQIKHNLKYPFSKRIYRVIFFLFHGRYYVSNEERKILDNI